MNRALILVPAVLSATLIAGCSSSSGGGTPAGQASQAAATVAPVATTTAADPFAGKTPTQILDQALAAAKKADSVHVVGAMKDGKDAIALDISTSRAKGGNATGSITMNDDEITIRRIGKTVYFKAAKHFWTSQAGADKATAALLAGRWIKASTTQKDFADFTDLTSVDGIGGNLLELTKAEKAALTKVDGKDVDGQATVGLHDGGGTGKDDEPSTLYVSTADPTLPLLLQSDSGQKLSFTDWNKPVSVTAPKDVLDISK